MDFATGNILVVDDNEMNRDILSRRLAKKGHALQVAEGGSQALEMIESSDFDLVLLDIMMPGIDGMEVLEKLRRQHGPNDLPVIMATAKSESTDIVDALKLGANDYVTKPFDFPVVLARVHTQLALKKSRDELNEAHKRMKRDLEAAAKIQQTQLPTGTPDLARAQCAWRYVPCDELAGDTLNIFPLDDDKIGLMVLDVSGHGVPSALLSVTLSRMISGTRDTSSVLWTTDPGSEEPRVATPAEVAEALARRFPYDSETHQYFTMVYGILDTSQRCFTYISAGHPSVIHLRPGSDPTFHGSTGAPIALLPSFVPKKPHEQAEISLEPGDRIYLYSDGITEACDSEGEEFGEERIAGLLQSAMNEDLDQTITSLLDKVWTWGDNKNPGDDVSVLAIQLDS